MEHRVATRYARAFINAALQANSLHEADDDLKVITTVLESREEFRELFESPRVPREKKLALIDRLFADRARPITLKLLRLLVEKRREDSLGLIYKEFVRLKAEFEGVLHVEIQSAVPLEESEVREITTTLANQTGKRIEFKTIVDPALIGGVAVKYGDYVLDGTVSSGLRRLREKLFIDVLKQA